MPKKDSKATEVVVVVEGGCGGRWNILQRLEAIGGNPFREKLVLE